MVHKTCSSLSSFYRIFSHSLVILMKKHVIFQGKMMNSNYCNVGISVREHHYFTSDVIGKSIKAVGYTTCVYFCNMNFKIILLNIYFFIFNYWKYSRPFPRLKDILININVYFLTKVLRMYKIPLLTIIQVKILWLRCYLLALWSIKNGNRISECCDIELSMRVSWLYVTEIKIPT